MQLADVEADDENQEESNSSKRLAWMRVHVVI